MPTCSSEEENVLGYVPFPFLLLLLLLLLLHNLSTFIGLKLFSGKKYKSIVEKSFHVSRAVVELSTLNDVPDVSLEVHVVLHNIDYIVCILSSSTPQTPLDLEISEGEEMTVYVKLATPTSYAGSVCVHLTGYYYMDQSRDGCYDDDEEEEEEEDEELFSEEEYDDVSLKF